MESSRFGNGVGHAASFTAYSLVFINVLPIRIEFLTYCDGRRDQVYASIGIAIEYWNRLLHQL